MSSCAAPFSSSSTTILTTTLSTSSSSSSSSTVIDIPSETETETATVTLPLSKSSAPLAVSPATINDNRSSRGNCTHPEHIYIENTSAVVTYSSSELLDVDEKKYKADHDRCCPPPMFVIMISLLEVS